MKFGIRPVLVTLLVSFAYVTAFAQVETTPVQVQNQYGEIEEYSVLKADKTIRQGTYVRYRLSPLGGGLVLFESGSYEHGLKEGEWRNFSTERPLNKIVSKGLYHAGLPEGLWTYYQLFPPGRNTVAQAVANSPLTRAAGFSVNVNDTTARVQAMGLYTQGMRVGVWQYYDRQGRVVQKVDHFTNTLLYWQPDEGTAMSGEAVKNHPILYVGGKQRLREEIFQLISPGLMISMGKNMSAEFVYLVNEASKQTGVSLAGKVAAKRSEKQLLAALAKVPPLWIAQVAGGLPQTAEYRVRITTAEVTKGEHTGISMKVEPLGD